jgi:hypothetical protein
MLMPLKRSIFFSFYFHFKNINITNIIENNPQNTI